MSGLLFFLTLRNVIFHYSFLILETGWDIVISLQKWPMRMFPFMTSNITFIIHTTTEFICFKSIFIRHIFHVPVMHLKDGVWPVNYESVILFFFKFEHLEEQNKISICQLMDWIYSLLGNKCLTCLSPSREIVETCNKNEQLSFVSSVNLTLQIDISKAINF